MNSHNDKVKKYARLQLQLTTPSRVICLLHTRCANLIFQSISEISEKRKLLDHAQNIIVQLERSLKIEDQLSRSMYLLYDYCYCQLESGIPDECKKAHLIISKLGETFNTLYAKAR